MSEPVDPKQPATGEPDAGPEPALDDVEMRDILRSALGPTPPAPPTAMLKGVQRRLRARSRGKFYADGWSTSRSPRTTYLVTSVIMLVLIGFLFAVLIPWSGVALP